MPALWHAQGNRRGLRVEVCQPLLWSSQRPARMGGSGEVSEWLKEHAWKVCKRLNSASGVRIPLSPPVIQIGSGFGQAVRNYPTKRPTTLVVLGYVGEKATIEVAFLLIERGLHLPEIASANHSDAI